MLIFALAMAAPTPFTEIHQRDILCVVELAVVADEQRRGVTRGPDVQADGKRWAGLVGTRIVQETGQPRELVAFAMNEAAKARAGRVVANDAGSACIRQMKAELAIADAVNSPLPKPVKTR